VKLRVKPGQIIAGPDLTFLPDGTVDLPEPQALALVRAGHADADPDEPPPHAETTDAPEGGEAAALK
jgi:hypothetical protein